MSRSGYTEDGDDQWAMIRWRGAVNAAIKGKRGQAFLCELAAALDAMPDKRLVSNELQAEGDFCALGVVGQARGLDLDRIDPEDWGQLAREFGISKALAREIMYENDESVDDGHWVEVEICGPMRPHYPDWGHHQRSFLEPDQKAAERRWARVRRWADSNIGKLQPLPAGAIDAARAAQQKGTRKDEGTQP